MDCIQVLSIDTHLLSIDVAVVIIQVTIVWFDITAIPDVIPTDDITQHERTVTSAVVQWKVPNYYNAPITMYSLNLCQKINDDVCTPVNDNYPMNINVSDINVIEQSNRSIVRYVLVTLDVVICSYLHRYNISGLQPFSSSPYLFSIRAINDIASADFSEPVALILVNRSEII